METAKMCKHNMKLYPIYHTLSTDFIFFYTINVLFLIQVKHFSPATIVLTDSFYALFSFIFQIPASIIIDKIGRKKSLIFGNIMNCIYLLLFMLSQNIIHLIIAEMICAFSFSLKDTATPSILNNSIPLTSRKSEIFAKLSSKGISNYYILNSISLIISGFFYNINKYIPIFLSLSIVILALLLSTCFIEPLTVEEKQTEKRETNPINIKDGLKYIFKSNRLKSLIIFSSIMSGLISLLANIEVSIVEELSISPAIIGFLFAFLEISAGLSAKKQEKFHLKFKNKSLTVLGITISLSCIFSTIGIFAQFPLVITFIILALCYTISHSIIGFYKVLINKYLSNFTNHAIDSKIFSVNQLLNSISQVILGISVSLILEQQPTYKTMLIIGFTSLILFLITAFYMRKRLGLKVNEYSQEEVKYSNIDIKELI